MSALNSCIKCPTLNVCIKFLKFSSSVSGSFSISAFASLIGVPVGIASSAVGMKTRAITAGIKKYKSIIKKKKKMYDKIVLLDF